jgi:hypothetical protein
VDISDLVTDAVAIWQYRNYSILALFSGCILLTIVAEACWNDPLGRLLYAGIIRIFFFQQSTNCVNSLANYLSNQPYVDAHSPRNHIITALFTSGEGYHDFHHEFSSDLRNGVRWFDYNPTKWAIFLVYLNLRKVSNRLLIVDITVELGWDSKSSAEIRRNLESSYSAETKAATDSGGQGALGPCFGKITAFLMGHI